MEDKEVECKVCQSSFLKSHFKRHMNVHREKVYKCSKCQKALTRKSSLVRHMMLHTGEKPFKCSECQKAYSDRSTLMRHMTLHSKERPFKCSYCDKTFSRKVVFVNHMTIHTGKKSYECTECKKAFLVRSKLMQHMMVHTGERRYKCLQCKEFFSEKNDFMRHTSSHTGAMLYECSHCQMTFFERYRLQWHMRSHFVRHIKVHEKKTFDSDHSNKGFHCKADQTCNTSLHSKYDCDKLVSVQQTFEDKCMSPSMTEKVGSPKRVKQEVGADSLVYKTDSCPELASTVLKPFVKTEMDEIDIVKEEI